MRTISRSAAAIIAVAALCAISIPATTTPAAASGDVVAFRGDVSPGTIVVRTSERRLYLVLGQGRAMAYPVGVGRAGRQWAGKSFIDSKRIKAEAARDALRAILDQGEVGISGVGLDKYGGRVLAEASTSRTRDVSAALLDAGVARRYSGGHRDGWCP